MADDFLTYTDQKTEAAPTWADVVAHVERVKGAAQMGLRSLVSFKAITESCAIEAELAIPSGDPHDERERVYRVARYAAALALARYGDLLPHDRAWLDEQVKGA